MNKNTIMLSITVVVLVVVLLAQGLNSDQAWQIAGIVLIIGIPLTLIGSAIAVVAVYVYSQKTAADAKRGVDKHALPPASTIVSYPAPGAPVWLDDEPREFTIDETEDILNRLEAQR